MLAASSSPPDRVANTGPAPWFRSRRARSFGCGHRREGECSAGLICLHIVVCPDRPPDLNVRRTGIKVDVAPAECPGFLGADPGGDAQRDIGPDSGARGRPEQCGRLFSRKALARSAGLPMRGVYEGSDVAADIIPGFGVPDGAGQRVVSHGHGSRRVGFCHGVECHVDVIGCELAQSPGADRSQDRREHVLVLLDGLWRSAGEPASEPVLSCPAQGVVLGRRLKPGFKLCVKRGQPTVDDRLGLAGHLAADALAVRSVAEADDAAPPACAPTMPGRVGARSGVVEIDCVVSPAAACCHGSQDSAREPFSGAIGQPQSAASGNEQQQGSSSGRPTRRGTTDHIGA